MNYDSTTYDIKTYRLWLRYSNSRFEIRAGLQKINFGSSNILRPLMWFDKMDFRDPLHAYRWSIRAARPLLFQSTMQIIWLWTLYGNDKTKGLGDRCPL
ncbi:MAG: hypothetical protein MZV63_61095 [Marinilabiliales bacterium]|nr:hypothetical protein [Marinilabiliales bacterium]